MIHRLLQACYYIFELIIPNNLQDMIQNMIYQVIQIYHSMLELESYVHGFYIGFLYFFKYSRYLDLIMRHFFYLFISLSSAD